VKKHSSLLRDFYDKYLSSLPSKVEGTQDRRQQGLQLSLAVLLIVLFI